jgi:hypothetical protein
MLLTGLTALVFPFMLNKSVDEEIFIQQHSPVIRMPIIQRLKGYGTIKNPNKIYVYHNGKKYVIDCSNPVFRSTAGSSTIAIHYDSVRDKIVLPDIQIKRHYFIQVLLLLVGLMLTGKAIVDMRRMWLEKADS